MLDHIASLILALTSAAGLFLQSGIPAGKPRKYLFAYYTNLSNLAVLVYELIFYFTGLAGYSGLYAFVRRPVTRYVMMLAILITNLIYHFVLGPAIAKALDELDRKAGVSKEEIRKKRLSRLLLAPLTAAKKGLFDDGRTFAGNLLVHYFVPLFSFARWIAFAPKDIPFYATFVWLGVPFAYLIFSFIRANTLEPITRSGNSYPYDFLSPDKLTRAKFIRNVLIVTAAYYVLGLVIYLVF